MTHLTENNGWSLVWMNGKYYIRHQACGSYLRYTIENGCLCVPLSGSPRGFRKGAPVDELIVKKYNLLTKDEL